MTNEKTASQKQIDFINRLKAERHWLEYNPEDTATNVARAQDEPEAYVAGVVISVARDMWRQGKFDKMSASSVIEALLAAPEKPKPQPEVIDPVVYDGDGNMSFAPTGRIATPDPAPAGMHKFGGVIFEVKVGTTTGKPYARALVEDGNGGWHFEYVSGAVRNLSTDTLLSREEAEEFGRRTGTCCVCGRTLTNQDSIEAGIGPICSSKF